MENCRIFLTLVLIIIFLEYRKYKKNKYESFDDEDAEELDPQHNKKENDLRAMGIRQI